MTTKNNNDRAKTDKVTPVNVEAAIDEVDRYVDKYRRSILSRYPLLFSFLVTFGVVSIWYGFEALIAQVTFLAERPLLVLFIGVVILLFTGTLYKKLSHSEYSL